MTDLEAYRPFEHPYAGNDLQCLERAHKRARFALRGIMLVGHREQQVKMKEPLPARDLERCHELLGSRDIQQYEATRVAWAEMSALLPSKLL